jgi:hypothetical protein
VTVRKPSLRASFVVAPPAGARVRTRLRPSEQDAVVLQMVGEYLGRLAGVDLARRCAVGSGADGRTGRKRALTAASSSRWAGAITRTSNDQWQRGWRNLLDARADLRRAIRVIQRRLAIPVGERCGRTRGYATRQERKAKQQRLQHLQSRLAGIERRIGQGRVSVVRGGRRLAKAHHRLDDARLTEGQWRQRWEAERWFLTADGEADKRLGNETIRVDPEAGWLELKLPTSLSHLANIRTAATGCRALCGSATALTSGPRKWPPALCGTTSPTNRIVAAGTCRRVGRDRHHKRSPCSRRSPVGS